jgi:hypothetical protein
MSKAILKFDLSDPDDLRDFKRVSKLDDVLFTLMEITRMRKGLEWDIAAKVDEARDKGDEFTPFDALDLVYDSIFEKLNNNNIIIDDLI